MTNEELRRRLTAILSADVEGYSRLMGDDERATVETITAYRKVMTDLIEEHHGRVVDAKGDNVLSEFPSVVDAIQCAVKIQKELKVKNSDFPEHRRMEFRIGINLGDVIEKQETIYGDGVNIAARLESLAEGGGICISGTAFDQIGKKVPLGYEYLGEQRVKNIEKPIRVYRALVDPESVGKVIGEKPKLLPRRWTVVAILIVILAAGVLAFWKFYLRPDVEPASVEKMVYPLPDKPSIAILPFTNMSGDPEQEYFSDGMTDDLITDLSKISGLFVIARNSVFTYKGRPVKIKQVGRELGVRYVLEGSVRRANNQVRINAQLIDAKTGGHLWADRYDGKMDDIFALQDRITNKIVSALAVKLTSSEKERIELKETDNIEAYDNFVKGWAHYLQFGHENHIMAASYFQKAIELDANYWRAYAGLAHVYYFGSGEVHRSLGFKFGEAQLRAYEYVKLAMKNPTPYAHRLKAYMNLRFRLYEEAIAEAERAIALAPNDPMMHGCMANIFNHVGRPKEAINFTKMAMRQDPRYTAWALSRIGMSYFCMGQLEEAVTFLERAIMHNQKIPEPYRFLAASYAHLNRNEKAQAMLEKAFKGWNANLRVLRLVMYHYPFKDAEVAERFADGLLKAGLPGKPSGYYKIFEENRLSGEEIKKLLFGRTGTGFSPRTGNQAWFKVSKDGSKIKIWNNKEWSDSGECWLTDELRCLQFKRLFGGLKVCSYTYRNPDGTPEEKNEYLSIQPFGISPWSPVD